MGTVHVLTGPDHLSALVTLSANVGNFKAFWYGVRWGIGHSLGLILVGGIFIGIDAYARSHRPVSSKLTNTTSTSDSWDVSSSGSTVVIPDKVSFALNTLVGVFMLLLGSYSLYRIYRQIKYGPHDSDISHTEKHNQRNEKKTMNKSSNDTVLELDKHDLHSQQDTEMGDVGKPHEAGTILLATIVPRQDTKSNSISAGSDHIHIVEYSHVHNNDTAVETTQSAERVHSHVHSHVVSFGTLWNRKPLLALLIGIIHGISGPGSVLGVIPAVQIHNVAYGFLYIGLFCIISTLVMGVFAALYGIISHAISSKCACSCGKNKYITTALCIEAFSCFCSFFVGVLWIVLLATHKMDTILG